MIKMVRKFVLAAVLVAAAHGAPAQELRSLIADRVSVDGNKMLAQGNVTVFMDTLRVIAPSLTYNRKTDDVAIQGPLTIIYGDGTTITATRAALNATQERGLLESARVVFNQRMQLTAADATRQGELTSLRQVAATACQVCPGETPLWEIRAKELVRDASQERIWFSGAHFRIKGLPVVPLPNMSIPDAGVNRARGFLRPTFNSGAAGPTFGLPYFLPIGDHQDLTITPNLARKSTSVDLRYRRAFAKGSITGEAVIAQGRNELAQYRGIWMRLSGKYSLANNWSLAADGEWASNRTFLKGLDIDTRSQLDSRIQLTRVMPRTLSYVRATYYDPLRETGGVWNNPKWYLQGEFIGRRPMAGGFVLGGVTFDGHARREDRATADRISQGRLTAYVGTDHRWIVPGGVELTTQTRLQGDGYWTKPVGGTALRGARRQAHGALSLAWPLRGKTGSTTHVITPRLTLSASQIAGYTPAGQDSTAPEYDRAGLHRFTRLPGEDTAQNNRRAALSVDWRASTEAGRATWLSFGRLLQDTPEATATSSTGLAAREGNWLIGAGASGEKWAFDTQISLSDEGKLARAETRANWNLAKHSLTATHGFYAEDTAAGRPAAVSELRLSDGWRVTDALRLNANTRLDLTRRQAVSSGLAVDWQHDCVRVKLSASHKHKSSFNLTPSTQYGFEISIDGFSTGSSAAAVRSCSK